MEAFAGLLGYVILPGLLIGAVVLMVLYHAVKPALWPYVGGFFLIAAALVFFILALPYENQGIFSGGLNYVIYGFLAGYLLLLALVVFYMWSRKKTAPAPKPASPAEAAPTAVDSRPSMPATNTPSNEDIPAVGKTYLFQCVNVIKINLWDVDNEVSFEFLDSIPGSGQPCGRLICRDIIMLKVDVMPDTLQGLAIFVCDIVDNLVDEGQLLGLMKQYDYSCGYKLKSTPTGKYHHVQFLGSEIGFTILCYDLTAVTNSPASLN